jgi:hypothetical protein
MIPVVTEGPLPADTGSTYVAPEEVGALHVLDPGRAALLSAWVARLIPGDAAWPSAAQTDAVAYVDAMLARAPRAQPGILAALDALAATGFGDLDDSGQGDALRGLESSARLGAAFASVLEMTYEAYYRDPAVVAVVEERTGFRTSRPRTGTPLAPFDESRLDRVRALPPRWRPVTS